MGKSSAPAPPDTVAIERQQAALNDANTSRQTQINRFDESNPTGQVKWTDLGNDKWTRETTLSPQEQAKYDADNRMAMALLGTAEGGLGRVNEMMGTKFDISDIPGMQYGVEGPQLDALGKLGAMPQANENVRNRAEEAYYKRSASRLDPQIKAEENAYATKLSNQGLAPGSEAYERAMGNFRRGKNDAYEQARSQAIIGGGEEMQRLFGMEMQGRGQEWQELLGTGQFNNAAKNQMFANAMANLSANNAARGTSIQERLMQRQLPLNEINALRTGNQSTLPQFGMYGQAQSFQPSNMLQAAQMGYQMNSDKTAADNANAAAPWKMAAQLGGMAMMSDRRLKSNIKRIGETDAGLPLYTYKIGGQPAVGVMADETRAMIPDAVHRLSSGFDAVDYSKVK